MAKSYSDKLKDPRWQKKRLQIFNRDKFKCTLCGDKQNTLHVHHTEYLGEPWEIDNSKLKTVCKYCHEILHELKDYTISKVVKKEFNFGDCIGFYAYDETSVSLMAKMEGSPIQLVIRLSYESLSVIYKNKPKIKK